MRKLLWAVCLALVLGASSQAVEFTARAYECVPGNEVFASVLHRIVRGHKETEKYPKTRYSPTSMAVGYVYQRDTWHAGAAFNYESGSRKLNYDGLAGYKVRTTVPGFSLFGGIQSQSGIYLKAHSFLGFSEYKARDGWVGPFPLGGGSKNHKTVMALGAEAGKTFEVGYAGLLVTPHIGLDYAYAPTERYQWNIVSDAIKSQSYFEIPLGVGLSATPWYYGGWSLTPKVDATLVTSLGKMDPYNAHPGFAFRTADAWKVAGISGGRVGGRLSAGVDASMGERLKVGVNYSFEGRNRYQDHRLSANLGLSF